MIAIIGAMAIEVDGLIKKIKELKVKHIGNLKCYYGTIGKKQVVVVRCGVGKVYSSLAATALLTMHKNISLVINLGVAGGVSKSLNQGDFAIGLNSIQHDYDLSPDGLPIGQVAGRDKKEFNCDFKESASVALILKKLGYTYETGTIVSGDQFINCKDKVAWMRSEFNAIACDMETAAIAQVCEVFNKPFLSLRSISDNADGSAAIDFNEFCSEAAARSIEAVSRFLQ